MADHGAVEAVFGHYRRSAPAFLRFPPFGSSVLEPDLDNIKNNNNNNEVNRCRIYGTEFKLVECFALDGAIKFT